MLHRLPSPRSSASGGTIASVQNMMKTVPASELAKIGSDAYYLAEAATGRRGEARVSPVVPTFIAPAGVWSGPFFMVRISRVGKVQESVGRKCGEESVGRKCVWGETRHRLQG